MQETTNSKHDLGKNNESDDMVLSAADKQRCDGEVAETLPPIPGKHYFTIGEMSRLCQIKPHVLRYWEHEFTQLKNVKRRGNRRYYTHQQVLIVRQIRSLLYEQGYTIPGAKVRMAGEKEHKDSSQSKQLIRQIKAELEEVLSVLKENSRA